MTCFRGNERRNYYGEGPVPTGKVQVLWRTKIGALPSGHWTGVGWTGQPLIVEWPKETRRHMNFLHRDGPAKEVIVGALDGNVHFYDAATGKPSRPPLKTPYRYPIKGTVTVDPRGYPLLYVGCGVDTGGKPGFRIFSLVDFRELLFLDWKDKAAPRRWPGSDSNVLVLDDTMYLPAENGLLYVVALNTKWDPSTGSVRLKPKVKKVKISKAGTENSMAVWQGNGYFADNKGDLFRMPLKTPEKIVKIAALGDDADSTPAFDTNGYMYIGIEKDKRTASSAKGKIFKIDPKSGRKLWTWEFDAQSVTNVKPPANPINGGVLSTGAIWPEGNMVYFTTSHHPKIGRGHLVALDLSSGKLIWRKAFNGFSWSSPLVVDGRLVACDSVGAMYILDAATGQSLLVDASGKKMERLRVNGNVESSPIVWKGRIYVGLRGGAMICVGNKGS